jgi:hypothetical protein
MPGFNQRGPEGRGPMTGRRMGRCANYGANPKNQNVTPSDNKIEDQPENNPARGYGFGHRRRGRGRGMGLQNRYRGGF